MEYKYFLREELYYCDAINSNTYGIAVATVDDGVMSVVTDFADISTDKNIVQNLIYRLDELGIEPHKLKETIQLFI
jgi:hypothetical protein